jgi:predicted GTPase
MIPTRVLIMGAAGRDFHNFNVVFRTDRRYQVIAFTAEPDSPGPCARLVAIAPPDLNG